MIFSRLCGFLILKKLFLGLKNKSELSIFGLGEKLVGLISQIFLISSFQLLKIDNLPYVDVLYFAV